MTEQLLDQCAKGDRKSQYELYRYCFNLLMPIAIRYYTNEQDAVDALNRTFVKVINGLKKRSEIASFNNWARRILHNTIIDIHRAQKSYHQLHDHRVPAEELKNNSPSIDYNQLDFDAELIIEIIQALPEPGRTIFNLVALEGYSHKDTSTLLDISVANSKFYLHKMRKILKEKLLRLHPYAGRQENSLKKQS